MQSLVMSVNHTRFFSWLRASKQHRVKTKRTSLDAALHQRATSPESLLDVLMHLLTQYEVQLSWRDVASECCAN
jgi:hypothetical protein